MAPIADNMGDQDVKRPRLSYGAKMNCQTSILSALSILASVLAWPTAALADVEGTTFDCYDVIVRAEIVRQTPSAVPDCDDCLIISWPWFLELNVKRVVSGNVATGKLLVMAIQHTSFRKDLGLERWWLRRNSLGGFNLLRFAKSGGLPRCPLDAPPAMPYVEPGRDKTLDELFQKTVRAYLGEQE